MTVKRIVIERVFRSGKGYSWQFRGVRKTGTALYEGYDTAEAACHAAAQWAAGNE